MKNDSAFVVPVGRALLFLFIIICISFFIYLWMCTLPVECDSVNQVELTGLLRGFERNKSYWDVKIGNQTYLFDKFDESYMKSMIGYNIMIFCCYRHDSTFQISHYDLISCFINEVE